MIYRGLFSAGDLLEQVAELIENSCGIARYEIALRVELIRFLLWNTIGVFEENTNRLAARIRAVTAPRPIYQNVYSLCLEIFWSGSVTVRR